MLLLPGTSPIPRARGNGRGPSLWPSSTYSTRTPYGERDTLRAKPGSSRHFATIGGYVHNLYAYLLISVGLVGLGLYLNFLNSLHLPLLGRGDPYHQAFFFAWLVTAMATGHLIFYYYWGYLYLLYFARLATTRPPSLRA